MWYVEQELRTRPEHMSSPPILAGGILVARSLVYIVYKFFCPIFFLPLYCLPLWLLFTASDYPLCIFKHFVLPQGRGRRSLALCLSHFPVHSYDSVLKILYQEFQIVFTFLRVFKVFIVRCSKERKNILSSCTYFKICKWDYNIVNRYFLRVARSIYRNHQCTCAKQKLAK